MVLFGRIVSCHHRLQSSQTLMLQTCSAIKLGLADWFKWSCLKFHSTFTGFQENEEKLQGTLSPWYNQPSLTAVLEIGMKCHLYICVHEYELSIIFMTVSTTFKVVSDKRSRRVVWKSEIFVTVSQMTVRLLYNWNPSKIHACILACSATYPSRIFWCKL